MNRISSLLPLGLALGALGCGTATIEQPAAARGGSRGATSAGAASTSAGAGSSSTTSTAGGSTASSGGAATGTSTTAATSSASSTTGGSTAATGTTSSGTVAGSSGGSSTGTTGTDCCGGTCQAGTACDLTSCGCVLTGGSCQTGDLSGAAPADAIDLHSVVFLNSPDVADWPATATLTGLDLQLDGAHVDFTKRDGPDSWPDVPFGAPGDSLEYTLWLVENIGGQWYASGGIEYWRGLDRNGGPPSGYGTNWFYDPGRWGPMANRQPAVGELVGFLVTAGDARNNGNALVQERSNVVLVPFPDDTGATFTY